MDIYRINKSTLTDIADAIRAKTGAAGEIFTENMAELIMGITGGGAGDSLVRWVTFMNGALELYKMPVLSGDNCKDPISHGDIGNPTKESTAAVDFTYSGWSFTDGGAADSSALLNVTEDRTVYAAYTESARKYTINFYDGETLWESMQVAFGETPAIANPSKDGYSFTEWQPALAAVTGDADYYAQWKSEITFAGGTWADIAAISEAGEAQNYFNIGDQKTITVGDTTMKLILIGFDHDTLANGSGKAGMTIAATTTLADTMPISNFTTLANTMRTKLKPQLPSDLQSVIKTVKKPCDVNLYNQVVTPVDVSFDLFPLSLNECKITKHYGRNSTDSDWENHFTTLGTPYQYFINKYNSGVGGPKGTFLNSYPQLECWFRQWIRAYSPAQGLYSYHSLGSSVYWLKNEAYTNNRKVMLAFCI